MQMVYYLKKVGTIALKPKTSTSACPQAARQNVTHFLRGLRYHKSLGGLL